MSDSGHSTIKLERPFSSVAVVTLACPERHNALNGTMIAELTETFNQLGEESDVCAVVLRSEGKSFSAGADLVHMEQMTTSSREDNLADAARLAEMFRTLYFLPKPTVAAVQGHAYGGGVGLIACCDVAVAVDDAMFSFPEVRLGLVPAVIAPYVVNAIGSRVALHWFLTGAQFDAGEALRSGLVHHLVAPTDLAAKTDQLCDDLVKGGPQGQSAIKAMLRGEAASPITPEVIRRTVEQLSVARTSQEARDRLSRFSNHTGTLGARSKSRL
jgi:methylglutaconyl-CoA hydratase